MEEEKKENKEEAEFFEKVKTLNKETLITGSIFMFAAFICISVSLCFGEWLVEYVMYILFGIAPVAAGAAALK